MPEMPEIQAHAERLTEQFAGAVLQRFVPFNFTALKTARPEPKDSYGEALIEVGRRGKYLLLQFPTVTFVVHLMQGGRLLVDSKQSAKPRGGQARFVFADGPALLLTEQGSERRAGVWATPTATALDIEPLSKLGPEAYGVTAADLATIFAAHSMRLHGFLRDQKGVCGIGRRLANEVCHHAKLSPFASTGKLGLAGAEKVVESIRFCCEVGLAYERTRPDMSSSEERPGSIHRATGKPCPVCNDTIREVSYTGYTVNYCPTCQTDGKILADNTTSKFLK